MAQQAVVGQGDEEHHQRVDLGLLGLEGEVQREQQRPGGIQTDPPRPQPAAKVVDTGQRTQRGQQRGQQERHAPITDQRIQRSLRPHQHRWLVRIQLGAPVREQPVAAVHHLLGDQREAGFVGRPGIAHAQAGPQNEQGHQGKQPELSGCALVKHGAGF